MNDLKTSIVSNLKEATGLDVYYENIVTPLLPTPCITYLQIADIADAESLDLGLRYSRPSFRIKVWGNDIEGLALYAQQIDERMFEDRYTRIGYNELTYNGQIQIVMTYQSFYKEKII